MSQNTEPELHLNPELIEVAKVSKAWPFEEARKLIKRVEDEKRDESDLVSFQTGYGPSGLPHIGTFGEVARTLMVRHAFRVLTEDTFPTRLICFSDDMDGFRKVPGNVPNQEELAKHLNKPLTKVPDPFGEYEGFAQANNAKLCSFLDKFGFDYVFASATDYYENGRFDAALLRMLEVYDKIMDIMLPTLGPERRETYSPFLPICQRTGHVLQVPILERDINRGTIVYCDPETNENVETLVTGGKVKCQWKADWALRWFALDIDYEMAGKDLIDSVKHSSKICNTLGKPAPEGFNYELFLDELGQKISKSIGNGITIEEWLTYASPESLSLFMFQKPKTAKRLHNDVIPKTVDDYYHFIDKFPDMNLEHQLSNPVWHIHSGKIPEAKIPVPFSLLLNLVSASNASNESTLWGFIERYAKGVTPENNPELGKLVHYAIRYYDDQIKPKKVFRIPDELEIEMLEKLDSTLSELPKGTDGGDIQTVLYDVARSFDRYKNLEKPGPDGRPGVTQKFFSTIYKLLLGQEKGPRFGSFIVLYGINETRQLIKKAISGELAKLNSTND